LTSCPKTVSQTVYFLLESSRRQPDQGQWLNSALEGVVGLTAVGICVNQVFLV